ncbi:GGDEF domain-containing protein [Mycobacterium sp. C31M]
MAEWWREPVDYNAYVQYFSKRSLAGAIRIMIGCGIGLIGVITGALVYPSAGDTQPASQIVLVLFAGLLGCWAVLWCLRPWPTRQQSRVFIITADVGIAAMAVTAANWLTALFALNCFALISVYLMFFDGPKSLALHTSLILVATMGFVVVEGADTSVAGRVLGAVIPLITTPLGIQFGIRTLRQDANESANDPLTGLLNRRGLHLHLDELLQLGESEIEAVAVLLVDLDRFKDINDTYGHAAGDEVLTSCAQKIRSTVGDRALVARVGGEEFVIVDRADPNDAAHTAELVRQAIMTTVGRMAVTASLGVTIAARADFMSPDADPHQLLDTIIARADRAMFDAKRDGGNRTHHL